MASLTVSWGLFTGEISGLGVCGAGEAAGGDGLLMACLGICTEGPLLILFLKADNWLLKSLMMKKQCGAKFGVGVGANHLVLVRTHRPIT